MYAVSKSESLNHSEEEVRHDGEEKKLCLCLGVRSEEPRLNSSHL